jgi:hypothetical protein
MNQTDILLRQHEVCTNQKKTSVVKRLLLSPDLNLDELEDETRESMEEVRRVFGITDC